MGSKGVFQGIANPLSSKAILDSCVMPTCLSGCENWLLNDVLLSTLEAFQGFVGCRSLHLSRFHSHLIPRIVLGLPSMRARILCAKLGFLSRISTPDNNTLSSLAFRRLQSNNSETALVQQCRYLQEVYTTDFTSIVLSTEGCKASLKQVKKDIVELDASLAKAEAEDHASLQLLLQSGVHWPAVWDEALDRGPHATGNATTVLRMLTRPSFGEYSCNVCSNGYEGSYFNHIAKEHLHEDTEAVIAKLSSLDALFEVGYKLAKLS